MWTIIESTDSCGSEICRENCEDGCTICAGGTWQPYADFEREKLGDLFHGRDAIFSIENHSGGFYLLGYASEELLGYDDRDCHDDSESSRLLNRAEFLKIVCEKEDVEWLPKEDGTCLYIGHSMTCKCHKPEEPKEQLAIPNEAQCLRTSGYMQPKEKCSCACHGFHCIIDTCDGCRCTKPENDYYTKEQSDDRYQWILDKFSNIYTHLERLLDEKYKGMDRIE